MVDRTPLQTDQGSTNETKLDELDDAETRGLSRSEAGSFGTVIEEPERSGGLNPNCSESARVAGRTRSDRVRIEAALATATTEDIPVGERYVDEALLGRGGMGMVWLRHDRQIGRQIAIKTLRRDKHTPRARERFLREARVQAQLEHPSIVPVYDLGFDGERNPWFSMRRVAGKTLASTIEELRANPNHHGPRRLLTALSQICLAVDFVHRRGVVHRDLKPENIMLGEFGEVYLLDWGIADLRRGSAEASEDQLESSSRENALIDLDGATVAGIPLPSTAHAQQDAQSTARIVGTPGYIAPELLFGQPITPAADIYSLGAILFEAVTRERLHQGKSALALVQSTIDGPEHRPSVRAPQLELPPELDTVIGKAIAREPADRYPSARALHEAIEALLDGQRDEELRRRLAAEHVRRADELLADSAGERRAAIQSLARALALNPGDPAAAVVLRRLLTTMPSETPGPVRAALERSAMNHRKNSARAAAWAYIYTAAYLLPFVLWAGILDMLALALMLAGLAAAAGIGFWAARLEHMGRGHAQLLMVASNVAFALVGVLFGPFIHVPAIISMNGTAYAQIFTGRQRWVALGVGALAIVVPVVLEVAGVLPAAYVFDELGMRVLPRAIELERTPVLTMLAVFSVAGMLGAALAVGRVRDEVIAAEQKLQTWSWQIQQLVPEDMS